MKSVWDWLVAVSATVFVVSTLVLIVGFLAYGFGWTPPESWRMGYLVGVVLCLWCAGMIGIPVIRLIEIES